MNHKPHLHIILLTAFLLAALFCSATDKLPSKVDNSQYKFFPPVIRQRHNSCGQAAGCYYAFTYEINCLRNTAADTDSRRYPTHFTYNFLNNGKDMGTLSEAGWRAIRSLGVPSIRDYGSFYKKDTTHWMSGYNKYLRALRNRVKSYRDIDFLKPESLNTLKRWLYNHEGKRKGPGGMAVFRAGVRKAEIKKLSNGKHIYTKFKHKGGHFMAIAGYDDTISYDFNGDGKITNNVDLNNDKQIDLRDYERGAFLIVNSRGLKWCDNGKIYVPYRLFALPVSSGGIFHHKAQTIEVQDYKPTMTLGLKFSFSNRKKLRLTVSAQEKTPLGWEKYSIQPRMFSEFWGSGNFPMRGKNNNTPIEICVDISKMRNFLKEHRRAGLSISFESRAPQAEGYIHSADLVIHKPDRTDKFINISSKKTKITQKGTVIKLERSKISDL